MEKLKSQDLLRSDYWMQTYTNGQYDFVHNYPEDINIVDIGRSLSQQVRFTGHLQRPLSVAQHCLTVSAVLEAEGESKEAQLIGLLHDAHEAYIGDINAPYLAFLKDMVGFDIEKGALPIKLAIGKRFNIDIVHLPSKVIEIDKIVLRTEAESLFTRCVDNWNEKVSKHKLRNKLKTVLGCNEAYMLFTKRFHDLNDKVNPKNK